MKITVECDCGNIMNFTNRFKNNTESKIKAEDGSKDYFWSDIHGCVWFTCSACEVNHKFDCMGDEG